MKHASPSTSPSSLPSRKGPGRGRGHPTAFIRPETACNVANGLAFATCLGKPLNFALTICAQGAAPPRARLKARSPAGQHRERVLDVLREFCRAHRLAPHYVWALENPPSGGMGLHIHIAMHLPMPREGGDGQFWISKLQEAFQREFRWSSKRPEHLYVPCKIDKLSTVENTSNWIEYDLKGAFECQGNFDVKRAGGSRSLDGKARRVAGFLDAFLHDAFTQGAVKDWGASEWGALRSRVVEELRLRLHAGR